MTLKDNDTFIFKGDHHWIRLSIKSNQDGLTIFDQDR